MWSSGFHKHHDKDQGEGKMIGNDLYRQDMCAGCRGYFYLDELQRDAAGGPLLCMNCRIRRMLQKRRQPRTLNIPIPFGVSLIEILAVALILGMLISMTIPTIMYLREKAVETEWRQLYFDNQGTDIGRLAEQTIAASQQGQPLTDIPELSNAKPEDIEQLENKLKECLGIDSLDLQMGAVIKSLKEWQEQQYPE